MGVNLYYNIREGQTDGKLGEIQFERVTSFPDKRKLRGALLVPSEGLQDTLSHSQPLSCLLDTGDFFLGGWGGVGGAVELI